MPRQTARLRRGSLLWLGLCLATLLVQGLLPSLAMGLAPTDLLVVYNVNLPDSQAVARYYAAKRQVPLENLVGLNAPLTETISRDDYELVLAEPLRQKVREYQAKGIQPALLLVYGIPLRVEDPLFSRWFNLDQEFLNLAEGKVRELAELCWRLQGQVRTILDNSPPATLPPPPVGQVIRQGQTAVKQAVAFLQQGRPAAGFDAQRHTLLTLIIKLAGSEPEYELYKEGLKKGGDPQAPLPPQLRQFALLRLSQQEAGFRGIVPETALELAPSVRYTDGLLGELHFWVQAAKLYQKPQTMAAVDSELALLLAEPYQKAWWLPNPFLPQFDRLPFINGLRQTVLKVARLDGPSPAVAQRLVDDALAAEAHGLTGTFYIDARGLDETKGNNAYAQFDARLRQLYQWVQSRTDIPVVLDNQPSLFPAGAGLKASLYVGWYSLAKYVDAFAWQQGAVAYHVASAECTTLRQPKATVWCKRLLEEGVAATLGPVGEPYLQSFPPPEEFFPLLLSGRLPLIEVYFRTVPSLSWRQVLVGDPLYNPFRDRPQRR